MNISKSTNALIIQLILILFLSQISCQAIHVFKISNNDQDKITALSEKYSNKLSARVLKDRLEILDPFYGLARTDPKNPLFRDFSAISDEELKVFSNSETEETLAVIKLAANPNWLEQREIDYKKFCEPFKKNVRKLEGVKIALDPGHIGGEYCEREERVYSLEGKSICEGDLNLSAATYLAGLLKKDGTEVLLTRTENKPLVQNKDLEKVNFKAFLRADYAKRVELINSFAPSLTILIHHNMDSVPIPIDGIFELIPGAFSRGELNDTRNLIQFLDLLFSQNLYPTRKVADILLEEIVRILQIEPFRLFRHNPKMRGSIVEIAGNREGVMARNLFMLREVKSPVILIEGPHMNYKSNFDNYIMKLGSKNRTEDSLLFKYAESIHAGILKIRESCFK
jgi:N-acetylmuramoyl-L-alanine amidase